MLAIIAFLLRLSISTSAKYCMYLCDHTILLACIISLRKLLAKSFEY